MPQRIILFNGPPSCGKDTAARHLFNNPDLGIHVCFDRMSMPIKRAFAVMYHAPIDKFGHVAYHEDHKEEVNGHLGVSYRQWQIDFSEKFMKPLYGENIFGRLFIRRSDCLVSDTVILVPDCGFDIEYTTLANAFGAENILVVKIYRPGCDFSKDSRSYLKIGSDFLVPGLVDEVRHNVAHLNNCGTKAEFETKALRVVNEWLEK